MMRVAVPEVLLKQPNIPAKTLLGPGPMNLSDAVNKAQTLPLLGHLHPEFFQIMADVKDGLRYVFQTRSRLVYAVSGAGHAGMESALTNLVEPGDSVLICQNGIWGLRAADMAERQGAVVHTLTKPPGSAFTDLNEIEMALKTYNPTLVFMCHGESSTGVLQPLEGLGPLCHRYNSLLMVDTVASLCGAPFYMDEWEIDCVYSGTQKALSCPPGLAPIAFGDKAQQKIKERKTKPRSFYLDANWVGNYWHCFEDAPRYHHTAPVTLIYALREALAQVAKEGLENSFKRHRENTLKLHKGLQEMGLELLVQDEKLRMPTLTTIKVPEGVDWKAATEHIVKNHLIEVAGGLGPTAGKIWRIGLMGHNNNTKNVEAVLPALKEALQVQKAHV